MPKGFFDFEEVIKKDEGFDKIVEKAQKNLQRSSKSSKKRFKNLNLYLVIIFLIILLIGLSFYSFRVKFTNSSSSPATNEPQKEFIQEPGRLESIISGQTFSVVVDQATPQNFNVQEESVDFVFLNNQKGIVTKIIASNEVNGNKNISGIEVYSTEYDNRLNVNSFSREVQQSLGSSYTIDEDLEIPKGFKLIKISNSNDPNIIYYTGVTSENYYVIKSINPAKEIASLNEYSTFIDNMIYGLYLN
ncbi:hypothetical protein HC864_03520 [Candidatus Gracilibacteria bacterium]|nr:hypothetical protein [Candidatus Gracilibacteria bacterium]